jgi:hypothetical protein
VTEVVNRHYQDYDVYIGRGSIYGNAWTHKPSGTQAQFVVATVEEAIAEYEAWLLGTKHHDFDQERRRQVLASLPGLRGKRLGCFCKPRPCHGDVLLRLIGELS